MEERDVSGERGEVIESTEQERIQNEEEVFIFTFMPLVSIGDQGPLLFTRTTADTSQLTLTFC